MKEIQEIKNGVVKINSKIVAEGCDPEITEAFYENVKQQSEKPLDEKRINVVLYDVDRQRTIRNQCFPSITDTQPQEQNEENRP